jgi:hypothetical protein
VVPCSLQPEQPVPEDMTRLRVTDRSSARRAAAPSVVHERPGDVSRRFIPPERSSTLDSCGPTVGRTSSNSVGLGRAGRETHAEISPVDDEIAAHAQFHVEVVLLNDAEL